MATNEIPSFSFEKYKGDTIPLDLQFSQIATFTGCSFTAVLYVRDGSTPNYYATAINTPLPSSQMLGPSRVPIQASYPIISFDSAGNDSTYGTITITDPDLKQVHIDIKPAATDFIMQETVLQCRIIVEEAGGRVSTACHGTLNILL